MKKNIFYKLIHLIKFCLVGGLNTLISLIIYYFLIYIGIEYMLSTSVSYIVSSLVGYLLNKFWVFKFRETKQNSSLFRYYIVYGSALIINMGCMYFCIHIIGTSKIIAPLLTLCVTVPYNYTLSRVWIFNEQNK